MREGTTSRVMAVDRPYGDFYGVSLEYFGFTLVQQQFYNIYNIQKYTSKTLLLTHSTFVTVYNTKQHTFSRHANKHKSCFFHCPLTLTSYKACGNN
jgi:hypothetical protein